MVDVYDAMGVLAGALERRMGYEVTADVLDGICELPTRREREEAVAWLAHEHGLLDVIAGEEARRSSSGGSGKAGKGQGDNKCGVTFGSIRR